MIETRQLRYFLAAAEEQNLRKASKKLHVDQSAVARQISALESQLGYRLFERLPRGIKLSAAGHVYAEHVRTIFAELETAKEHGGSVAKGHAGSLALGMTEPALHYPLVLDALARFRAQFPEIELKLDILNSVQQIAAYDRQALDAGFISERGEDYDLDAINILTDSAGLALSEQHRLVKKSRILLADLENETVIKLSLPASSLGRQLRSRGFKARRMIEVASIDAIYSLVEAGLGVSILVKSLVDRGRNGVVFKPIADFTPSVPLCFVWPRRHPSAAVQSFIEIIEYLSKRNARQPGTPVVGHK